MSRPRRPAPRPEPIALIGAGARLPGAPDLAAFGALLDRGGDAVTILPPGRFAQDRFFHPRRGERGRSYSFAAGHVGDLAGFDPHAFGLSPREAREMDPQQRLACEAALAAIEDAGIAPGSLAGRPVGVFLGASATDWADLRMGDPASADRYFMTGSTLSVIANRLTHVFDLRGPAQVIDTACSSSLVALHLAVDALRAGRLEMALAGGVHALLSPYPFIGFAQANMLSPSGRCRAFDAAADGYVRGEGAGIVLLKPLAAARRDGDRVRAVILATGSNAAGRTIGLALPSPQAQAALLRRALAEAGLSPDRVAYFEAHGTGTQAGDPIEARALAEAFAGRRTPLPIGSVKTNIGHLEPASGIAGLLKAAHVLRTKRIPPHLHLRERNPNIPWASAGLDLPTEGAPLAGRDPVVGVNSFGFGGTNATALLAAPPPPAAAPAAAPAPGAAAPPLLLSARTAEGLAALAAAWGPPLAGAAAPRAAALARGAAQRRDLLAHRLVARGADGEALAAALTRAMAAEAQPGAVAFVFSGNGAQWAGMAQAALQDAGFRAALAEADAALAPGLGFSVTERLADGVSEAELASTAIAQPLLFAIQHAFAAALGAQGIAPALVLGHSVGAVAAAACSGALTLPEAARLILARSAAQEATRGQGRMLALGAPREAAERLAAAHGLALACCNAPQAVTLAGPAAAVAAAAEAAEAEGFSAIPLALDYAFHSPAMEPVRERLLAALDGLAPGAARIPFISTTTGGALPGEALGAGYWWRNLREPVRFDEAIRAAHGLGARVFVEIGPQPVLQSYIRETLRAAALPGAPVPGLSRRDAPDANPIEAAADRATLAGADPRGGPGFAGEAARDLPPTPLLRVPLWFERTPEARPLAAPAAEHPLLGHREAAEGWAWRRTLDVSAEPWLADHRFGGEALLPATGFLEAAFAAAAARHPAAPLLAVEELRLLRAAPLGETGRDFLWRIEDGAFLAESRPRLSGEPAALHARARLAAAQPGALPERACLAPPGARRVPAAELLAAARAIGLDYGAAFQAVESVAADPLRGLALAALRLPEAAPRGGFLLHPVLADGALQGLIALLASGGEAAPLLPAGIARAVLRAGAAPPATAELRITQRGVRQVVAEALLRDAEGAAVAWLAGVELARLAAPRGAAPLLWHRVALPAGAPPRPDAAIEAAVAALGRAGAEAPEGETALLLDGFAAAAARAALAAKPHLLAAPHAAARAWLDGLAADGLARASPAGWTLPPDDTLPEAVEIWRTVLAERGDLALDLAWLAAAAEALPARLEGCGEARPAPAEGGLVAGLAARLAEAACAFATAWPEAAALHIACSLDGLAGARLRASVEAVRPIFWHGWTPGEAPPRCDLALGVACGRPESAALLPTGATLLLAEPAPSRAAALAGLAPPSADGWTAALAAAGLRSIQALPIAAALPALFIVAARPAPPAAEAAPPRAQLLAAADARALAEALATALGAPPPGPLDACPAPAALRGRALVLLPGAAPEGLAGRLAALARAAEAAQGAAERLVLVTSGAATSAEAAAAQALLRVLANEHPDLPTCRLDLAPGLCPAAAAARLRAALAEGEPEQALDAAGASVPRLVPLAAPPPAGPLLLDLPAPGLLSGLGFRPAPLREPGAGEVRLAVTAAGLNFRDVMWAQGLLPEGFLQHGFAGPALGMECAGVVEAAGPGAGFAAGARVFGIAPAALATHALTRAEALAAIPPGLADADAATVPVAFLTAIWSLERLARLAEGERVLLHGGAGAVGLAAFQVARALGARVAMSAGSEAKRAFLRALGADLVLDSRELGFAEELRARWGEVDVVVNALSGEAMEASMRLVAPFGRFVELGKRDFAEGSRVALAPLRRNAAYFAVDVDELPRARPEQAARLLAEIARRLAAGEIAPLPRRIFAPEEAEDAFRALQASAHVGKLVLRPPAARAAAAGWAPPQGVIVITGGTRGFGLATARWLAARGARRLALLSRTGTLAPAAAAALAALGARVSAHATDVTDAAALAATLAALRAEAGPIAGVVHAAAAWGDAAAHAHDTARFAALLAPKLDAARQLDRLTREDRPALFWLYSSAAAAIGNPGQAGYAAASAALEALARQRHAEGLPALAIAWGPIADAGVLAEPGGAAALLARRTGFGGMAAAAALDRLPAMLASGLPVLGCADFAGAAAAPLPVLAEPAFAAFRSAAPPAEAGLLEALRALPREAARERLLALITEEVARVLRLAPAQIAPAASLAGLGLDSLGGLELRQALEARTGLAVPLAAVTEDLTVARLAERALAALGVPEEAVAPLLGLFEPEGVL